MELLQNNGRFRIEILHRLDELTKALSIIASVLVGLTENGEENNKE
jgi:hypothetical protein